MLQELKEKDQEDRWTQTQIEDWFLETTETLEGAYGEASHDDTANAHKIHADLLATVLKNTDKVIDWCEIAKTAFKEVGSKLGVAAVAQSQANILRTVQDSRETAEELYIEAQENLESIFKDQPRNALIVQAKEERAKNLRSLNREAEADKLFMEAEEMKGNKYTNKGESLLRGTMLYSKIESLIHSSYYRARSNHTCRCH